MSSLKDVPCPGEIDYRAEYVRISSFIGSLYPECEVTTLDMVKLLAHECDTLRLALGIPTHRAAITRLESQHPEEP